MQEYYFLFGVAFVYTLIAGIQDLRTREVPNWLNFTFIAFVISYRAFYSIYMENYSFLFFGILGVLAFFLLANFFYYTKVFAGGDAKLLMGFGAVFPIMDYWDLLLVSIGFAVLLFAVGTIYSLIYSIFLAKKNFVDFKKSFSLKIKKSKRFFYISAGLIALMIIEFVYLRGNHYLLLFGIAFLIITPFLYVYLKAVEESCLIRKVSAKELTEGDWLEKDIRVAGKLIRKSVHGLSAEEIKILRKHNKKAIVRYGIPFVPAFFFASIIMALVFLFSGLDFYRIFGFLF